MCRNDENKSGGEGKIARRTPPNGSKEVSVDSPELSGGDSSDPRGIKCWTVVI